MGSLRHAAPLPLLALLLALAVTAPAAVPGTQEGGDEREAGAAAADADAASAGTAGTAETAQTADATEEAIEPAPEPPELAPDPDNPLRALAPFVGKTWRGTFAGSTPERPLYDVARWEWALSGGAIRVLHSLNDGTYGGETLLLRDPEGKGLIFFYFTTGGFYTRGSAEIEDGKLVSVEEVTGDADGVTELRSVAELLSDGRLRVSSRYRKDGSWHDGHTVVYAEDPEAEVVFHNPE